jgi:hypothetical protein
MAVYSVVRQLQLTRHILRKAVGAACTGDNDAGGAMFEKGSADSLANDIAVGKREARRRSARVDPPIGGGNDGHGLS